MSLGSYIILAWKYKRFAEKKFNPPENTFFNPPENTLAPKLTFIHNAKTGSNILGNMFQGSCLNRIHGPDIKTLYCILGDFLFGYVKMNKKADLDKDGYSDYGFGFNAHSHFLLLYSKLGKTF